MLARPAKNVNVTSKHLTKAEKERRSENEDKLKGSTKKSPTPPAWLTDSQKKIFRLIVKELKESGILCKLDVWVLQECVMAIDHLEQIEKDCNNDPSLIYAKTVLSAREKETKILFRCCNELSLSPQSRAKIANINSQAADDGTALLKQILAGENTEDSE